MPLHETTLAPAMTTSEEAEAGGILTIDLAAIAANWKQLSSMTIPVECAAVVKADAYGCGIEQVIPALTKVGCRTFFVADVAEGRRVRAVAQDAVIYVLNGLMPGTAGAFADANLRPVINSPTELAEWDAFVSSNSWRGGAALHVDTGMNRLGLTPAEAAAIAPRLVAETHGFNLLMSHLACADIPNHPMNDQQVRLFREIRILFRGLPSALANSAGMFLGGTLHCDLVRPGIALFGGNPTLGKKNPMRAAIEIKGRITQIREIKKGDTVGYGATWTAPRPSRLAVIAAGYGDGYPRAAGADKARPAANVVIAGKLCPLVGRVSMDVLAVDVTDLPTGIARRGELATLVGGAIGIDDLAAAAGTISYEILTNLGRRYHRNYRA
jgi:alanine racemase